MTPPKTNWLDEKPEEHFSGCLMILNIGQENIHLVSSKYKEALSADVANAHADGWMIVYAFDSQTGPYKAPEEFSNVEGMDFVRMMFDVCGRKDSDFSLYPDKRMEEFKKIGEVIRNHDRLKFTNANLKIGGSCKISGIPVLIPVFDIP